jgi:hypothetical protein
MKNKKSVLKILSANSECSNGDVHGIAPNFEIDRRKFSGDSVKLIYGYLYSKPSEKLIP